jgi:hypothetical protein
MKIGTKVHCTRYVDRRRNGFSVIDCSPFNDVFDEDYPKTVIYYDTEKQETVYIPYREFDYATIDKFKTIEKEFEGIYVGTTRLSTKLTATYEEWYGVGSISFRSEDIKKFAIIYYANNRKRLVPIDCLKESEDTE